MATNSITYPLTSLIPTNVIINNGLAVSTFSDQSLSLDSGAGGVVCNVLSSGINVNATGVSQTYLTTNELSLGGADGSASLFCSAVDNYLQTSSAFRPAAIVDSVASLGVQGQVLAVGNAGGSLVWIDGAGIITPTLQAVVDVGATISDGTAIVYNQTGTTTLQDLSFIMDSGVASSTQTQNELILEIAGSNIASSLTCGSLALTESGGLLNTLSVNSAGNFTTGALKPSSLVDSADAGGASGQYLTAGAGASLLWIDLPTPPATPSLQQVVNVGNIITDAPDILIQSANLSDSITLGINNIDFTSGISSTQLYQGAGRLQITSLIAPVGISDAVGSYGTSGQILSVGGVGGALQWITPSGPEPPTLQQVVDAGNTITDNTAIQWSSLGAITTLNNQNLQMLGGPDDTHIFLSSSQEGLFLTNDANTTQMSLNKTSLRFADSSGEIYISQTAGNLAVSTTESSILAVTSSKYWPVVINGTSYLVPLFIPT